EAHRLRPSILAWRQTGGKSSFVVTRFMRSFPRPDKLGHCKLGYHPKKVAFLTIASGYDRSLHLLERKTAMSRRLLPTIHGAILLCLVGMPTPPLAARASEPITYTIRVRSPATHYADVTATFPTEGRASIDVMMPIWSPGFYRVENYASRVQEV